MCGAWHYLAMADFDSARIAFPQSFELRLILDAPAVGQARGAITAAGQARGLGALDLGPAEAKGERFSRLAFSVTFTGLDQMRAFYADLAAIPGVRAVI